MWFKNIHFYRFGEPFALSGAQLDEALGTRAARPCGRLELACEGWSAPLGQAGHTLVHETDGRLMLCLRREEKVLPASVVRERVEARAFDIERESGRPVGRKERAEIRERVIEELLPRAFAKASHTLAYIDSRAGWLVVDVASARRAEELVALLRKTLGTLNVTLPQTNLAPESAMTHWLMNESALPDEFALEDECELRASGESESVVRCRHVDVVSEEVRAHVAAGRGVKRLAMNWRDRLSFVLHDDLSLRRLKFDDALVDEAKEAGEDEGARFDADFAIMGAELDEFLPRLTGLLSGAEA